MSLRYSSSPPCPYTHPRPVSDPSRRRMIHGPIQGMSPPTLLERVAGRLRRLGR